MDFEIGWNRFNLSMLGLWPQPRKISDRHSLISELIFWATALSTFSFIVAPQAMTLIFKSTSLDGVIENLSINTPIAFSLIKQLVFRYHKKALSSLVGQVFDDWSQTVIDRDYQIMMKNGRTSRMISIISSISTYLMLITFISLQIWSSLTNTSEYNMGGLLYPVTLPYDTNRSPNFELTWLGQFSATIATAINYSAFDTFLAFLVLHLCGQLSTLNIALEEIANGIKENDTLMFQERLEVIVNRHNQLARFAVDVENCFNLTLLIQTIVCTLMLCLTGYRMITSVDQGEKDTQIVGLTFFILHVFFTTLHLFIYCYVGEALLGHSNEIGEAAYQCNWYDLPPKCAISLVTVICRAKVPLQITAGKFSPFSLEFFNGVLQTSAGYLSVLLATKHRLIGDE